MRRLDAAMPGRDNLAPLVGGFRQEVDHELAGRALAALEEILDAGGPDAMKAAALILRMSAAAQAPRPPYRLLARDDGRYRAGCRQSPTHLAKMLQVSDSDNKPLTPCRTAKIAARPVRSGETCLLISANLGGARGRLR